MERHKQRQTAHNLFMKILSLLLLTFTLAMQPLPAQTNIDHHGFATPMRDAVYAPLLIFTNGPGRIYPFEKGQILQVGERYQMCAVPDRGCVFTNWMKVNVFTLTTITVDEEGHAKAPVISTVLSPIPEYINTPYLNFIMEPESTLYDNPGVETITESIGWQANFVPVSKKNQR
jgi:hypothetical protein